MVCYGNYSAGSSTIDYTPRPVNETEEIPHTEKEHRIVCIVGFEFLDRRDEKVTHSSRKTFQYSNIETTTRQEEH